MNKEVGFNLGAPPVDLRKYANNRPYTYVERQALLVMEIGCKNDFQYNTAHLIYSELFDRWSAEIRVCYLDKGLPVPKKDAVWHANNVLGRAGWAPMTGYIEHRNPIGDEFLRDGEPVSYGEQRLLKTWQNTKMPDKPKLKEIAHILGRRDTTELEKHLDIGLFSQRGGFDFTSNRDELISLVLDFTQHGGVGVDDYVGGVPAMIEKYKQLEGYILNRKKAR